jgi:nucleoside phosphorylase
VITLSYTMVCFKADTLLVFALKAEMDQVFKQLDIVKVFPLTKRRVLYYADQQGIPLYLLQTGIGPTSVRQALDSLPGDIHITQVINAGTCGALRDDLSPGDVISPDKIVSGWNNTAFFPENTGQFIKTVKTCITIGYSQNTQNFRVNLIKNFHADITDMEAWAVLAWASGKEEIPVYVIKSVSDQVGPASGKEARNNMPLCSRKLAEVLLSGIKE